MPRAGSLPAGSVIELRAAIVGTIAVMASVLSGLAVIACDGARDSSSPVPGGAGGLGGMAAATGGTGGDGAIASGGATPPAGGAAGVMTASGGAGGTPAGGPGGTGGTGHSGGGSGGDSPVLDAATADPCDRACLTDILTAYLDALVANDASSLPLAPDVRFTENGMERALTEGLWAVARSLSGYRQDFAEVGAGQAASFVRLEDSAGEVLLAVRLRVVERAIAEIETIVARRGEATFFSPQNLTEADPVYDAEISASERMPRDALIAIVDSYFEGLENADGSDIPFGSGASRNENGVVTASGASISNLSAFSYIETIERRYPLVDEERGVALPFALFEIPGGLTGARTLHIAELFKVEGGEIMKIHAIMVNQPFGTTSGWE